MADLDEERDQRQGHIRIRDTSVHVWEGEVDEDGLLRVLTGVIERMRNDGWELQQDAEVAERWPSLAKVHWEGRNGDLQLKARIGGRHLEFVFFHSIVTENPNGGFYDFQKMAKMTAASRALRLQCIAEMCVLTCWLGEWGYRLSAPDGFHHRVTEFRIHPLIATRNLAEGDPDETPLDRFNANWGSDRFERDETGWPSEKALSSCWRKVDRDGKPIAQGVTKYIRGRDGRLARGQVFGGINSLWSLVSNGRVIAWNLSADEFFDCERPDLEPRRVRDHVGRLKQELAKATKAEDYRRVATLGAVLARFMNKQHEVYR